MPANGRAVRLERELVLYTIVARIVVGWREACDDGRIAFSCMPCSEAASIIRRFPSLLILDGLPVHGMPYRIYVKSLSC